MMSTICFIDLLGTLQAAIAALNRFSRQITRGSCTPNRQVFTV